MNEAYWQRLLIIIPSQGECLEGGWVGNDIKSARLCSQVPFYPLRRNSRSRVGVQHQETYDTQEVPLLKLGNKKTKL